MASSQRRRNSTNQSSMSQNVKEESDFDMRTSFGPTDSSDTSDESEVSEYGRKGKKKLAKKKKTKRKSTRIKPQHVPAAPVMSDVDYDRDSSSPEFGDCIEVRRPMSTPKKAKSGASQLVVQTHGKDVHPMSSGTPRVVQIHLNTGAATGGTTINLDLSDFVLGKRGFDEIGSASLPTPDSSNAPDSPTRIVINNKTSQIRPATPAPSSKRLRMLQDAYERVKLSRKSKKGFCDLPFELRVRIYRQVFVTESPIDFASRDNFGRSSSFLCTCKVVHDEGRAVLYGENAFHFERSHGTRGAFFESTWKEIGFKDARRFLETIGTVNISMMRYVSFHFQDAPPSTTPHLDDNQRRFVNDPILHHVLKLIGTNARLSKIAFQFSGRRLLQKADYTFLQALSSIKSEEVIHAERMTLATSKVGDGRIIDKLQKAMTISLVDETEVDTSKKKRPTVKMFHERPRVSSYYGGGW